jgi:hypothetical protein
MTSRWLSTLSGIVLALAATGAKADTIEGNLAKSLSDGAFSQGITALTGEKADATLAKARAGIGMLTFMKGVERFSQAMYRHGFNPGSRGLVPMMLGTQMPIGNPNPQPLTYEAFRTIFSDLSTDMEAADKALAAVGEAEFAVSVDVNTLRVDVNADGKASKEEQLFSLIGTLAGMQGVGGEAPPFFIRFDTADVQWLRGYSNLIGSVADLWLMYDFRSSFDAGFNLFFPQAVKSVIPPNPVDDKSLPDWESDIADAIALFHGVRWTVAEAQRGKQVLAKLQTVAELNRATWRLARAETDDDKEWLPNARQKNGVLPGMFVTDERIDAWLKAVSEIEEILQGKKLVPHWRFSPRDTSLAFLGENKDKPEPKPAKGINMKAFLEQPQPLDLVLLLTGHAAAPLLQDGDVASFEAWSQADRIFERELFAYAFWFN